MDRRQSLKALALGSVSSAVLLDACKLMDKKTEEAKSAVPGELTLYRTPEEAERDQKLMAQHYYNDHEMATMTVLCDIIIPKDEVSGSASEAGVPAFIDFISIDIPSNQVPVRGGLRWLDVQCMRRYGKSFVECSQQQQIEMVDLIAYPERAKGNAELAPGVSFFNHMRDLTASGFYSSKIGIADIGYKGNTPNQWNGVPDDVLKQYGLAYTEKELKECVSY